MTWIRPLTIACVAPALAACASATAAPPSRYDLAREEAASGRAGDADREVKLALQDDPLDARSHYLQGCLLAKGGSIDQAMVGFRRTTTLDPSNADAAYNLGTLLLARGEPVAAAEWLERAWAIRPGHVPTCNNLAKAYFAAGLPDLAAASLEEALRLDPVNVAALSNLALLADAAGLRDLANECRRRLEALGGGAARFAVATTALASAPADGGTAAPPRPAAPTAPAGADRDAALEADAADLREVLRDFPHLKAERRGNRVAVTGWTSGPKERAMLDRALAGNPEILDLTTDDSGDPQRMIEVDAVLFVVRGLESQSLGFNFLRLVSINANYFASGHANAGTGFTAPGTTGVVSGASQQGWLFSASVDYDVNIANAADSRVAVLARPHLTTLSGTPAKFLSGGELIFRVSGLESGDIKLYPFGVTLNVTPTLLRTPADDGRPRIHVNVEAGRTSVLSVLTATNTDATTAFDKINVSGQAVLEVDQTLILSGLTSKESIAEKSGVPILSSIPLIKYLFSQETNAESTSTVIILLTPRDPAFLDARNRAAIQQFVEMRREFVEARRGTEEDFKKFTARWPHWQDIPPNRFASHFFLMKNSEVYRAISGQEFSSEDLELDILGKRPGK